MRRRPRLLPRLLKKVAPGSKKRPCASPKTVKSKRGEDSAASPPKVEGEDDAKNEEEEEQAITHTD